MFPSNRGKIMAATVLEVERGRRPALIHILWLLVFLPAASTLAQLGEAQPAAKGEARPETAPAPKSPMASVSTNPRGEPLLFETNSTEIRPGAKNWWSVSVSPDGKWIASGQGDGNSKGEVKIWERETGTIKHVIPEPK